MNDQTISVGSMSHEVGPRMRSAALGLAVMLLAFSAHANKYGEKHITSNTKLTDHQYGSVVFDADNISLDCNGYEVHISSYSKKNCWERNGEYTSKCGIVAINKDDIKIMNCRVVGGFDIGVNLKGTEDAYMANVRASAKVGFWLKDTVSTYGTQIRASGSDEDGMWIGGDEGGFFDHIYAENVGREGIQLYDSTGTYFNDLQVFQNNTLGLWMARNDGITVSNGQIVNNGWTGVYVMDSDNLWFFDTFVSGNGYQNHPLNGWTGMGINLVDVHTSHFLDSYVDSNWPPCDVYAGADSAWNDWAGTTIGTSCIFEEPR